MSAAGIVGVGLWIPDDVRTNDAWPPSFVERFRAARAQGSDFTAIDDGAPRPYAELFQRHAAPHAADPFKGSTERRVSSPDQPTVHYDTRAAVRALEDASVDARDVDIVLSSALVPDRLVPSNGPGVQHLAGCERATGIGVEAYCSAALAQLELASAMVESGRARFVLCVQSHHISRINDLASPVSPLFGDGSSAFVVGSVAQGRGVTHMLRRGDGSLAGAVTHAYRDTPGARWYRDASGPVMPGSDDMEGARGFTNNLLAFPIDSLQELCGSANLAPGDADALITIQPIVWFQPAVADGLGIPPARVPSTYDRYGHMGPVGFVANLVEARERGLLSPGARTLMYAHGAGMTRYAALYRW